MCNNNGTKKGGGNKAIKEVNLHTLLEFKVVHT